MFLELLLLTPWGLRFFWRTVGLLSLVVLVRPTNGLEWSCIIAFVFGSSLWRAGRGIWRVGRWVWWNIEDRFL
jgi:hypothetical protein